MINVNWPFPVVYGNIPEIQEEEDIPLNNEGHDAEWNQTGGEGE